MPKPNKIMPDSHLRPSQSRPFARAALAALLALVCLLTASAGARAQDFDTALASLAGKASFAQKAEAIETIAASGHERSTLLLEALLEGQLFYRKSDKRVVLAEKDGKGYLVTDALTGEELGSEKKRAVKKIGVNNALRGNLRGALAGLALGHPDPERRLAAAEEMLDGADAETLVLLEGALENEADERVRETLQSGIDMLRISTGEPAQRIAAIEALAGSLNPRVRVELTKLVAQDASGTYSEPDPEIRAAAARSLSAIERQLTIMNAAETVFFGISLGSILLLAAIGLAITFGVMGVINMAHGEMMMLGAYTTFVVQQLMPGAIDASLFVAIPAAFLFTAMVGIALERGVIRYLYGRPLETLLATFGVSLVLQQAVRSVFSPLNRSVITPSWMSGSWEITEALSLTYNRLAIILFCLAVFVALLAVLRLTRFGLEMRAVTQNRRMAASMGINTGWVDALTFGLGSGTAGVAGVALSQLTNVGPNLGQAYIVDCFLVVVFGGVGNLWGTLVGAMTLGLVNKVAEPYAGAVLGKVLILVLIILFIQRRPRGLFALKGRVAES